MICNDPAKFREELVAGFVAAYPQYVMSMPGGVVRATEKPKGRVAVVDGGGVMILGGHHAGDKMNFNLAKLGRARAQAVHYEFGH